RFDFNHAIAPLSSVKLFLDFRSENNSLNDFTNLANAFVCRSVRLKFEVRVQVLELPCILAPAPVDVRQHKIRQGKSGLPQQGVLGTFFCLLKTVQAKKSEAQEQMTRG